MLRMPNDFRLNHKGLNHDKSVEITEFIISETIANFNLMKSKKAPYFPNSRHSGEGRNPVISIASGCRIKSGMTVLILFARSS